MSITKNPEVVEAKKELLRYGDPGNNGVAIRVQRGRPPTVSTGPCHGFIRNAGNSNTVAIVSRIIRERGHYEEAQRRVPQNVLEDYYDWLQRRSPWSKCYASKSGKSAVKNKCVVLKPDSPGNMLQGALISTRHTWEYPATVNLWHFLKEQGVDENYAFVMSFMASSNDNEKTVRCSVTENDHVGISASLMRFDGFRAFMNKKPMVVTRPYNEGGTYEGVKAAWIGERGYMMDEHCSLFKLHGNTGRSFNPFTKAKIVREDHKEMSWLEYSVYLKAQFNHFMQKEA